MISETFKHGEVEGFIFKQLFLPVMFSGKTLMRQVKETSNYMILESNQINNQKVKQNSTQKSERFNGWNLSKFVTNAAHIFFLHFFSSLLVFTIIASFL